MTLLSVRDLTTTFDVRDGVVRAVEGVSFDVEPGETLGIVGESGSGKSVTALSILRLVPEPPGRYGADSRVDFEGRNLLELSARDLRRVRGAQIAMIFQEPTTSLNPVLTVGFQIVETILAHESVTRAAATTRAVELLELVGIPDPQHRVKDYPHEMSGGMQQRVMIAMALSCQPKLLIADEPTTALDVTIQAQILELLADLKTRFQMAVIFITHDMGVLAGIADRVAVMYGGQIVEQAPVGSLYERPAHPYTQGLLRAVPRVDRPTDRLIGIPGTVPSASRWPAGCRFNPRCPVAVERCTQEEPPMVSLSPDVEARCWLAEPGKTT
jgi:oligopeptide/dipeptide ABC transporter ATP-binding protein